MATLNTGSVSDPTSALQAIDEWSQVYGVPTIVTETIADEESGLNPSLNIIDTNNAYSTGLYQLNQDGEGAGFTPTALENPSLNAQIGIRSMVTPYQQAQAQGLTGLKEVEYVADHSGHPDETGYMPASYTQQLTNAYDTVANGSASSTNPTVTVPAGTTYSNGSGIGGYIKNTFWGLAALVIIGLGIWIMFNPLADLSSAIRALGGAAHDKATSAILGAPTRGINKVARSIRKGKSKVDRPENISLKKQSDAMYEQKPLHEVTGDINESFTA